MADDTTAKGVGGAFGGLVSLVIWGVGVYIAIKLNRGLAMQIGGAMLAGIFGPLYSIYHLATKGLCILTEKTVLCRSGMKCKSEATASNGCEGFTVPTPVVRPPGSGGGSKNKKARRKD